MDQGQRRSAAATRLQQPDGLANTFPPHESRTILERVQNGSRMSQRRAKLRRVQRAPPQGLKTQVEHQICSTFN